MNPLNHSRITQTYSGGIAQKCLDAKGQNVQEWEQAIDAIVARLYGLSEEEVKIIKGEMV